MRPKRTIVVLVVLVLGLCAAFPRAAETTAAVLLGSVLAGLCVGLPEGLLVSILCLRNPGPCIVSMSMANSLAIPVSLLIGLGSADVVGRTPLGDLAWAWAVPCGVFLLALLLLRLPFVLLCLDLSTDCRALRAVLVSIIILGGEAAALWGLGALPVWGRSSLDACRGLTVVPASSAELPAEVDVYFISANGRQVLRMGADRRQTPVARIPTRKRFSSLWFRPSARDPNVWDLVAYPSEGGEALTVVPGAQTNLDHAVWSSARQEWGGAAFRVGRAVDSAWNLRWDACDKTLSGANRETGELLECSFGHETLWQAIHLPGDRVLFQLGGREICLLDVAKREVGLWATGRGPVAVEKEMFAASSDDPFGGENAGVAPTPQ